jgi:hypothetical protein
MKTFCRVVLLTSIFGTATQSYLLGQSPMTAPASGCEDSHMIIALKNPRMLADGTILPGQSIAQARLALDENTTVRVIEYPSSGKDLDSYNSTIVIQRDQESKKYPLKVQIKGGEVLRLVEVARLCTSVDQGSVFLAFEAGATGAVDGFVVVRHSPQAIAVQALPLTDQGRIVVKRGVPDHIELWSAAGGDGIECDACKKRYTVQDCQLGQSVECARRGGTVGPFSPDKFMRARIEVRGRVGQRTQAAPNIYRLP